MYEKLRTKFEAWWFKRFHTCEPDVLNTIWFDAPFPISRCMHCDSCLIRNDDGIWIKTLWIAQ